MCGIAGLFNSTAAMSRETALPIVSRMADALYHRGPDDGAAWSDPLAGIALSHRRLAIIDLSITGRQPMSSGSGRYRIVFNGEIYNFQALRKQLSELGHRFRGHSDTEVMLAAFEQWGVEGAVKRFIGMFAFALWDKTHGVLHLGRDRLGEKPLYYGWLGEHFVFGSELKALRAHPAWRGEINRDALVLYMRHNYIPAPYSIYEGVYKLPPACLLTVRDEASGMRRNFSPHPGDGRQAFCPAEYWSLREVAESGIRQPLAADDVQAVMQLDALLRDAVKQKMVADVPLGAFLSGGIDSTTVVALMQAQSERPVKTFTIGFNEQGYDEAHHAKAVAQHLGTEHTELYVSPEEAMAVIPRLPALYDEPFSDSSQIPTFLVSQLARRHVTVALSGDGGDELFGGYNRYFWGRNLWRRVGWTPRGLRAAVAGVIRAVPPRAWDGLFGRLGPVLPKNLRQPQAGDKLHKLAAALAVSHPEAMYEALVSHWASPGEVVRGGREAVTPLTDRSRWAALPDFTQRMMYLDTLTYLPDDILVKVDRASMGVSLEARVPLLDHRVVEFAWRIPLAMKLRGGHGKWLLRQVMYRYVPKELVERPKMGFGVPIDQWLRGPLRQWAESLLEVGRLRDEGFFDPLPIHEKWQEHLSGRHNWSYHLWDVLMFQAWLEAQAGAAPSRGSPAVRRLNAAGDRG